MSILCSFFASHRKRSENFPDKSRENSLAFKHIQGQDLNVTASIYIGLDCISAKNIRWFTVDFCFNELDSFGNLS